MSKFNDTRLRYLFLVALDVAVIFIAFQMLIIFSSLRVGMFTPGEVLVIYGIPTWLALRGVIVRLAFKRVWAPTLILFLEIWIPIFITQIVRFSFNMTSIIQGFLVPLGVALFSALFSLLTDGVVRLYKAGKAIAKSATQPSETKA